MYVPQQVHVVANSPHSLTYVVASLRPSSQSFLAFVPPATMLLWRIEYFRTYNRRQSTVLPVHT